MNYIVGVDIGGTFTDCVAVDDAGSIAIGKALSTPPDFSHGAIDAVADAAQNLGLKNEEELLRSCCPSCATLFHTDLVEDTKSVKNIEEAKADEC